MIVDTSALAAILLDEPERHRFQATLAASERTSISAGSWIELAVVLTRKNRGDLVTIAEQLLNVFAIRITPVDVTQADIARRAYREFGRGSGHAARLNFGDCFSYALAKSLNQPLLFKGDDFGHTDVKKAIEQD